MGIVESGGKNITDDYVVKAYSDATYTYICVAEPGTSLSDSNWQVKRIHDSDGSVFYADGDAKYDNTATDLSTVQGFSYS